ncbi:hypothetical protein [Actinomadura opuntiae]|uniref:hypothetical protein n=1 Tax=Actinomadura sp. OS1-43 TaxID=604315 RepID=UPI00255A95C3|nr:hypothetical protein [Actinomadura sp. OS1-43]MDL4819344.1 hypothetical protein [Actinomadura sp. OS1-43]
MGEQRREPDVEIGASVEADELVVREPADVTERTKAEPEGDSDSRTDRRDLPRPVEAHTTYRNVRIAHRLSAWLTDPGPE